MQAALWPKLDRITGRGSIDHLERYYTPDGLAVRCVGLLPWQGIDTVLEPHAGGGAFLRALQPLGLRWVAALDVDEHSVAVQQLGAHRMDFLDCAWRGYDRVIGNPPFSNAEEHVEHALQVGAECAFLMPLDRLESTSRLAFWREYPPAKVWVLAERVWTGSRAIAWFWWRNGAKPPSRLEVVSWHNT